MQRRHPWLLAVLCGVLFLDGLDLSLVGVALPSIKSSLGVGDVAGLFQTSTQVGAAVVLAVVTAVVTSNGGGAVDRAVVLGAYRDGLYVVAGVAAAGLLFTLSGLVIPSSSAVEEVPA